MSLFRIIVCTCITLGIVHFPEILGQGFAKKNKYSSIEAGFTNSCFAGRDVPFRANRFFAPGLAFSAYTRQGSRVSNGFQYSLSMPASKAVGQRDSIYTFMIFQNRIHKFDFFLMIDFLPHRGRYQKRPRIAPYWYMGIGWIYMKPFLRYGWENKRALHNITQKSYDRSSLVLPFGPGVRLKITKRVNAIMEIHYNYTFTNQLDVDYTRNFYYRNRYDGYWNVNFKLGAL